MQQGQWVVGWVVGWVVVWVAGWVAGCESDGKQLHGLRFG